MKILLDEHIWQAGEDLLAPRAKLVLHNHKTLTGFWRRLTSMTQNHRALAIRFEHFVWLVDATDVLGAPKRFREPQELLR